jgi:hypothetical protein
MKRIICLLLVMVMLGLTGSTAYAKESPAQTSKYHKLDNSTLNEVKQKATFTLLVPQSIPNDWTVELKYPYPLDTTKPIHSVRLHYFDKDENYMLGIEQYKAGGLKSKSNDGQLVKLNGYKARFEGWANTGQIVNGHLIRGGYLRWVEEDTYIQIDSQSLNKDEMISIAKSIRN